MKVALVLLAAAGVVGYIYRKEILAKVQEHIQLVTSELDSDPDLFEKVTDLLKNPSEHVLWQGHRPVDDDV